jgi:hypothetical protein
MSRSAADKKAAALPQWVRPQLTELVDAAPEGDAWLHEIKFDGYRMHAQLDRGTAKLLTRTGSTGRVNIRRSPTRCHRSPRARLTSTANYAAWAPTASRHSA